MKHRLYLTLLILLSSVSLSAQEEAITDTTKMNYKVMLFLSYEYYRVNYTYQSVAPDGQTPVTLSAAMVFPKNVFEHSDPLTIDNQHYDASGLLLVSHHTMTKNTDAPTQTSNMQIEGPIAALGPRMIIISSDGYGFGATVDKPQAYLMAEATSRNNIDAVRSARRLLAQMGYTYGELFTQMGYSQGAHSAMALQRYMDTQQVNPEAITHIDYTFCGGGPYDIRAMLDTLMLPDARYMYPCALPLIIHGQIAGAGLQVNYSDLFRKPLDTKAVEWLDAKTYTTDQINDKIYEAVGGSSSTGVLVSDVLCTENFSPTSEKSQPIYEALQDNSLVSGWTPNTYTRFYLYHSVEDEIVPAFCMDHLYHFLTNECGVESSRLKVDEGTGAHSDAAVNFVLNVLGKLRSLESDYLNGDYVPSGIEAPIVVRSLSADPKEGWYNLQGQRLPGRPHTTGIYIYNGRKVMVGSQR